MNGTKRWITTDFKYLRTRDAGRSSVGNRTPLPLRANLVSADAKAASREAVPLGVRKRGVGEYRIAVLHVNGAERKGAAWRSECGIRILKTPRLFCICLNAGYR